LEREGALPARGLHERRTCSILGDRNLDLREQLVRLESGRQMSDEEVIGPELARTAQRAYVEARPERDEGGRQLGGRVGVGNGPADRPAVPDLDVANPAEGFLDQRHPRRSELGALDGSLACERAGPERTTVFAPVAPL